jgi:nucleotide sugar dehydrogenase
MLELEAKNQNKDNSICIIGLGYVGLTLAVALADSGVRVFGIEKNLSTIQKLESGQAHFYEEGINGKIKLLMEKGLLSVFSNFPDEMDANTYIVTVGTPLDEFGIIREDFLIRATEMIASRLRNGDHVILRSTVKIGTTRNIVAPILDKTGKIYFLSFCPERTLEGSALKELKSLPQIVSGLTEEAASKCIDVFQVLTATVIRVSTLETAEMIKLIDNVQRDVTFAFANEVALFCDAVGVYAPEVIKLGRLGYSRSVIAWPGLVGGPCLSKDSWIYSQSFMDSVSKPEIAIAARHLNERLPEYVVSKLAADFHFRKSTNGNMKISVLGLAFKGSPETDDVRGSMVFDVVKVLREKFSNCDIFGYDPIVPDTVTKLQIGIIPVPTLEEAFANADLIIVLTNHKEFLNLNLENSMASANSNAIVFDFWNLFDRSLYSDQQKWKYKSLGGNQS